MLSVEAGGAISKINFGPDPVFTQIRKVDFSFGIC